MIPDFVRMCDDPASPEDLIIHHAAFPPNEVALMGMAIKYATLKGKNVMIVGEGTAREEMLTP